jgi:hypothetical protein
MPSTIQRNTNLSPVNVQTKMFTDMQAQALSFAWLQWFRDAATAINASPQLLAAAPATSAATGDYGDMFLTPGFAYFCVAQNHWQRVALTDF